jgi:hypothetical protein
VQDYPKFCPEPCVPIFGLPATTIVVERSKPVRITLLRDSKPGVVVVEQVSGRARRPASCSLGFAPSADLVLPAVALPPDPARPTRSA